MKKKKISKNTLARLRLSKNLTQAQLGQQIGVSRSFIAALESGRKEPSSNMLMEYRRIFGAAFKAPEHFLNISELNEQGREKLLEYFYTLRNSEKYIK